jgi:hypothetical protein
MVDDPMEYLQKFSDVVNRLDVYNAEEKQRERMAYAKNHTYEKQLEKIFKYLKQYNLDI